MSKFNRNANTADIYQRVTDKIIASLEQGTRPWLKPWTNNVREMPAGNIMLPLRSNGVPYRGINVFMLWAEASIKGYSNPTWVAFKQAQSLGGMVRKGEHGALVVYANTFTKTEKNDSGDDVERSIPFLRGYTVFNVEQVDGLPERFYKPSESKPVVPLFERIEHAESFVRNTGAMVAHGGDRAFFAPSQDRIQMPPFHAFRDKESYYATLLHELGHWTGHDSRLHRVYGSRFGDEKYAAEELVAEMTSAYLCAALQITLEPREDHASYVASWLKALRHDKRCVFTAASLAQSAADHCWSYQHEESAIHEDEDEALAA